MTQPRSDQPKRDYCGDCARWHVAPVPCGWNSELLCGGPGPAHKRGYRWTADDGNAGTPTGLCWACAQNIDLPVHVVDAADERDERAGGMLA